MANKVKDPSNKTDDDQYYNSYTPSSKGANNGGIHCLAQISYLIENRFQIGAIYQFVDTSAVKTHSLGVIFGIIIK